MITVIIPVYNSSIYLDKCISSLIDQSYTQWECIMVNDGSSDNSLEICRKWARKDKRIHVRNQDNQGVSSARNSALKLARGKYIAFIDSDDWVGESYLADMVKAYKAPDIDLVFSGNIQYSSDKRLATNMPSDKVDFQLEEKDSSMFLNNIGLFYGPCSKLYKTKIIRENNILFPKRYSLGEDLLFNFKYLRSVRRIIGLPVANYNYRILQTCSLTTIIRDNFFDIAYAQWRVQREFLEMKGMWTRECNDLFLVKLWGIVYDSIFYKKEPSVYQVQRILKIDEIKELRVVKDKYECSQWIKRLIISRQYLILYICIRVMRMFKNNTIRKP